MPEFLDPMQLYEALMRVLGMREREEEHTLAQRDARIPRSAEGYMQDNPEGYVPPGPYSQDKPGTLNRLSPWFTPPKGASQAQWSNAWLGYMLQKYNAGEIPTPEEVLKTMEALRSLHSDLATEGASDAPEFTIEPDLEKRVLRHLGFEWTPKGLVPISEEDKPPLG